MELTHWDPLLHPFLRAHTERERAATLESLLQQSVHKLVRGIVQRKLGTGVQYARAELEDVVGDINIRILQKLQSVQTSPDPVPIRSLTAWIRQTAYNETSAHLRHKYPRRRSVDDKLRYLLEGDGKRAGIGMWRDSEGERVCGFDAWRDRAMASTGPRLLRLLEDPRRGLQAMVQVTASADDPARQVGALFQWVGHPIPMDDLIGIMAELWNRKDTPDETLEPGVQEPAYDPQMSAQIVQQFDLKRLWEMILELSAQERISLLLQAQDTNGNALLELLILHNIADFDRVASAVDVSPEELAALWNDLPLDDARIAQRLGVPVSKITMLRYNARERLRKKAKKEDE